MFETCWPSFLQHYCSCGALLLRAEPCLLSAGDQQWICFRETRENTAGRACKNTGGFRAFGIYQFLTHFLRVHTGPRAQVKPLVAAAAAEELPLRPSLADPPDAPGSQPAAPGAPSLPTHGLPTAVLSLLRVLAGLFSTQPLRSGPRASQDPRGTATFALYSLRPPPCSPRVPRTARPFPPRLAVPHAAARIVAAAPQQPRPGTGGGDGGLQPRDGPAPETTPAAGHGPRRRAETLPATGRGPRPRSAHRRVARIIQPA